MITGTPRQTLSPFHPDQVVSSSATIARPTAVIRVVLQRASTIPSTASAT
ncbi:hypothetical protein [Streptomyces sp. NPDC003952]